MSPETGHNHEAAAGLVELEGLLVAAHHRQRADEEGEAFARRMPWLTTHQHQEVARLYADCHVALTKEILRTVISRSEDLKAEYSQRYELLKKRLLVAALASLIALAMLMATLQYGYLS
ncbi:hypothetical protein [Streptomyces botrytidirepellens]|uniref:Uncharacterized protein n=1 Tax=Streptomyces botrytidirepellens TaxID=2486417 RepID=A0A3M8WLC5_9ACTN|nr:hypothetical protein [Streptomyces botrytidirepellens]RNG30746.1 hypothetical protein EEJ42_09420 [Streptomyces botrytidirepellens]